MSDSEQNVLAAAGAVRIRSGYLHMLDLLSGLAARGHGAALVCDSLPPELARRGLPFPVYYWRDMVRRWPFADPFHFGNVCAEQRVRLIHVHGGGISGSAIRAMHYSGLPVVFSPHAESAERRAVGRLAALSQRVIALSEYRRQALVNRFHLPRENIRIVPPGIEAGQYAEIPPQFGGRAPVIGTVAPLEPGRGQNHFLEAAALVVKTGREAQFVVAGDGRQETALRRQAAALGIQKRVTFATGLTGYSNAIALLDIFVRPAVRGGMGYTILEAMAMGKALLATATDDVPEMIAEGRTGLMVSKGDSQALADAMIRLLDHPELCKSLGMAARASAATEFSMEQLVRRTLEIYDEAVETHSRKEEAAP